MLFQCFRISYNSYELLLYNLFWRCFLLKYHILSFYIFTTEKNKAEKILTTQICLLAYFLNIQLKISNRIEKYIIKSKFFSSLQSNVLYILPPKNVYVYISIHTYMSSFYSYNRNCTTCLISCPIAYKSTLFFFSSFTVFLIRVYHSCLTSH